MRVLVFGINYAPELTGIGKYTGEMCAWLTGKGHEVSVVSAMPYYPEWEVHNFYKKKKWHKETLEGVSVYRCPIYIPKEPSSLKRILHELSFQVSLIPHYFRLLFSRKHDLVLCIAPPFHLGFLPMLYAKLRGAKLIYHIQDLQVDAARDLNMIKNKTFLKFMLFCERFLLKNSNVVSSISEGMISKILVKGISREKILLFPNWVDTDAVKPLPKEQSLREQFGLSYNDKVVLYSGNLGEKQGLDLIIEVANHLKDLKDLKFVICGSGGAKESLIALTEKYHLNNVFFFDLQPYDKLSALLATGDLHLVLQKSSASDLVMPSKLTSILAAGAVPLVTALPGTTLYNTISEHRLGVLLKPESVIDLKEAILETLKQDISEYRANARLYSENFLKKEGILINFEKKLKEIITG